LLVLNSVPTPARALASMAGAVRSGGTVAIYVWDCAGRMQLMRHFWDAAVALNPAALELDEGRRFPMCSPTPLAALFQQAGLRDVETRAIDVPTVFRDFDDYWSPFLGGQAPAPGYCMSLPEDRRAALRERIRGGLPVRADGSSHLIARAWAVRARVHGTHPGPAPSTPATLGELRIRETSSDTRIFLVTMAQAVRKSSGADSASTPRGSGARPPTPGRL
jgi:hypothetical protein